MPNMAILFGKKNSFINASPSILNVLCNYAGKAIVSQKFRIDYKKFA